ncbi:MAG TPA: hypothetical protein VHF22_14335, partial [Planctomycetota bacterium]|nr:hypothetical protein [Planctomycetota bacterium]
MAGQETDTVRDVLRILRRRLVLIVALAIPVMAVGAYLVKRIPDEYVAQSLVVVEPGHLKTSKDPTVSVPRLSQLIGTLRQAVLSRESLRELVKDLELYGPPPTGDGNGGKPTELQERVFYASAADRARRDIKINIVTREDQEFVEISARAKKPELAARAVTRVEELLGEKNRELRIKRAQELRTYVQGELARASERAAQVEAELGRYRDEHRESLPENSLYIQERLIRLGVDSEERKRRLDEIEHESRAKEADIAGLLDGQTADSAGELNALQKELGEWLKKDDDLRLQGYGTQWVDRVTARTRIDALTAKIEALRHAQGPDDGPPGARDTPKPAGVAKDPARPAQRLDVAAIRKALVGSGSYRKLEAFTTLSAKLEDLERERERIEAQLEQVNEESGHLLRERSKIESTAAELSKRTAAVQEADGERQRLVDDLKTIQRFLDLENAHQGDVLRTIEAVEVPLSPDAPKRTQLYGLVLAAGLGLGVGASVLLELLNPTYSAGAHVEDDLDADVLAVLPKLAAPPTVLPAPADAPPGDPAEEKLQFLLDEQVRRLRHAVLHHPSVRTARSVLITSAVESEGKSTVAARLARSIAETLDTWAILVETDFRRPRVAAMFGVDPGRGLKGHLLDGLPLEEVIQPTSIRKLSVLCAGSRGESGANAIESAQFRRTAEELASRFQDRIIIFDAPPIVSTPEPLSLSVLAGAVLLVVRADATPRPLVRRAAEMIPEEKLRGVVLNAAQVSGRDHRYYSAPV